MNIKQWITGTGVIGALGLSVGPTVAQDADEVPRIMVTATRTEKPVEDVSASVQVIGRQTIESFSGRSVTEILGFATGVSIAERGNETRVSLRGMNTNQTLILVDGLRRTDKISGNAITNIQVEDIERIEIVRGPMSALYGSDAMGGVINIITSKPQAKTTYGMDVTVGGTDGGQRETATIGGYANWGAEQLGHRVSFELGSRGDYRIDPDSIDTDRRDEERRSLSYRGQYQMSKTDVLRWGAEYARQDDEGIGLGTDGIAPVDMIETEDRYHVSLGYDWLLGDGLAAVLLGRGVADSTSQKSLTESYGTTSTKNEAQMQYTFWPHEAHTLSAGYAFLGEELESTAISNAEDRKVNSVFLQDQWDMTTEVNLTAGARYDDYSDFGSATSPNVTLAWRPGAWTLRAGYGEAFRAPSMMELYADYALTRKDRVGNPDLKPETSNTREAAVAYQFGKGNVELVVFRTKAEDLIQKHWLKPATRTTRGIESYQNIDQAEIDGVEFAWALRPVGTWQFNGSVEYLDAVDATTGEPLTHRADITIKLDSSVRFGPATYLLRVNHTQDYFGVDGVSSTNTPYYSDFTSVDFRLDFRLAAYHGLFFGVNNLFDEKVPDNLEAGGSPYDPGARYYYAGYRARF
ncbi:MAG: TonB-dependent receptor [Thiohalomonadaceae bacterium]